MSVVLAVGYASLAAAVLAAVVSPRAAVYVTAAACGLVGAVGIASAAGYTHASFSIASWLGFGQTMLVSDGLAGIFLAATGVVGAAVSLALAQRSPTRLVGALHALILLAICAVIGSDQAFVFLLAWETITLSLYLLGSADRDRPDALVAGYFAGGVSKLGGGALLAAFGLLYAKTGSFEFAVWAHQAPNLGSVRDAAFFLFVVGFGSKLGLIPFQGPLPPLYAAAPGPSAATISLTFFAAFYGLWRLVFAILGAPPLWWGELLVAVGGVTALVGILYAVTEEEIKRFLGFSSVEHAGIATIGFGVALVGEAAHLPRLAAAGLLAATLQVLMHGVAKALALVAADRVQTATGQAEMRPLGGLGPRLPLTATGFGLAVVSLAALPPFGGFVSEWLMFMALLQAFRVNDTIAELVLALGGAALALTAGVALLAFAKLYGGIFLGHARERLGRRHMPTRLAPGFVALALIALVLGPIAPWEIRWLGHGLGGLLGSDVIAQAVTWPLVLGPVYHGFSVMSPTWLAAGLTTFALAAFVLVRALARPAVRRAPVWVSGTAVPVATVQYRPEAYSNPIRVVLSGLYRFKRTVEVREENGKEIRVARTRVVPVFEDYFYRPIAAGSVLIAGRLRRLQSGSLGMYLLYILAVLLAALALIPALGH
ncbi:MAG TPA: proton-conducting transporter membrane subunit [Gaiellaceae bacterium]|nr:proton-conducting transporter membrane subunit [Gaiellaceae bacterium]